ncbi:MAG: DUF2807 domain-containing protein [Spirochaetales bacterium]|nr:MAG: DUF2807 domain-containing protein [Spirochaetales bacterium]
MRKILPVLIIVLIISASACSLGIGMIFGSGIIEERSLAVENFSSVSTGFGMKITITEGTSYSVVLRSDDNIIDKIRYEITGTTLRFYLDPLLSINTHKLEADITMPLLDGVSLSGGAVGTVTMNTVPQTLTFVLSGGSRLHGLISAGTCSTDLSGGSTLTLSGSCGSLTAGASGGSGLNFRNFRTDSASVGLSGGSHMDLAVSGSLSADLSGGSRLTYYGNAVLGSMNISGGSILRQSN